MEFFTKGNNLVIKGPSPVICIHDTSYWYQYCTHQILSSYLTYEDIYGPDTKVFNNKINKGKWNCNKRAERRDYCSWLRKRRRINSYTNNMFPFKTTYKWGDTIRNQNGEKRGTTDVFKETSNCKTMQYRRMKLLLQPFRFECTWLYQELKFQYRICSSRRTLPCG